MNAATLGRDLRVLARIALVVGLYWTLGTLIRWRYRRCQALGQTYWVDESSVRGIWHWQRDEDIA